MRVDFSNEVGYRNSIVSKAAKHKRTRSLKKLGENHKRWLEEECRNDAHFGVLSHVELHKQLFGSDAIAWLKGLFNTNIKPEFTHNIDIIFTAKLIDETWGPYKVGGVDVEAKLLAQALTKVKVGTSFGFTLITKLSLPLNLSQSHLCFKNKGDVSATFILNVIGRAKFGTGDIEIAGLENFPSGIPKLIIVGPNFKLVGAVDAACRYLAIWNQKCKSRHETSNRRILTSIPIEIAKASAIRTETAPAVSKESNDQTSIMLSQPRARSRLISSRHSSSVSFLTKFETSTGQR